MTFPDKIAYNSNSIFAGSAGFSLSGSHLLHTNLIKRPFDPSKSRIRRLGHEACYTFYKENEGKRLKVRLVPSFFVGREA